MAISSQNSILNQWVPPFSINSPREGQVLVYDSFTKTFTNRAMPFSTGCGSGGVSLDDLGDVTISSPENGDVLTFLNGQWINAVNFGGNNITGMNVGTGVGVFKDKVQTLLRFKSLLPGDNVRIEEDPCMNTITIHVDVGTPASFVEDAFSFINADVGRVEADGSDFVDIVGNGGTISTAVVSTNTVEIDWHAGIGDLDDVSISDSDQPLTGQVLEWDGTNWTPGDKLSVGSSYFIGLIDTPDTYINQAGKVLAIKLDETGIEFVDIGVVSSPVRSVFGRLGDVVAQSNDYGAIMITYVPSQILTVNNVQDAIDILASRVDSTSIIANTAVQPGDDMSELVNDVGFITDISNETLNDLRDVNATPVLGDMLIWDGVNWVNSNIVHGGEF